MKSWLKPALKTLGIALLAALILPASAQIKNAFPGRKTRILFLLDGSGSMLAEMGPSTTNPTKKEIAPIPDWKCPSAPIIINNLWVD